MSESLEFIKAIKTNNIKKINSYIDSIDISYNNFIYFRISLLLENTRLVRLLLEKGIDLTDNVVLNSFNSVCSFEIIKLLVSDSKIQKNSIILNKFLDAVCTCQRGDILSSLKFLLNYNINLTSNHLYLLLRNNEYDCFKLLFDYCDEKETNINRCFSVARYGSKLDLVKWCVQNGADITLTDVNTISNNEIKNYLKQQQLKLVLMDL